MRKKLITSSLGALLSLITITAAQAQSGAYFSAVTNLNPYIYLPLTETVQPPATLVAANLGTLGAADNGVYNQGIYPGVPGAIAGSSDTAAYLAVDGNSMFAAYDAAYAGDTSFTIEFWMSSANEDPGEDCIIDCVDAASPRHGWLIYTDGNEAGSFNFRTYYGNSTATALNYNIPVPGGHILANTWYHVVVTYNGATATAQGYINGQAAGASATSTTSPTYLPSMAGAFGIGSRSDNSFTFYPGAMDEVAFYPTVLSASDISNHYAAGIGGIAGAYTSLVTTDNPQLYFRLDDGTLPVAKNYGTAGAVANGVYQPGTVPGSTGPDYSGMGGAGSLAVQFPQGPATLNGATVLDPGAALQPAGVNANTPITVSAWVLAPYAPTDFDTIVGKGDTSYRFDMGNVGSSAVGFPEWTPGAFGALEGTDLGDGTWHFWVGTWDGSNNSSLYIDGAQVSHSSENTVNTFNSNVLDLGAAPDYLTRNFDGGSLCQVAIFTNALTQDQVVSLYTASGITGFPPIITSQPQSTVAAVGSTVTFSVDAEGFPPFSYVWYGPAGTEVAATRELTIVGATTNNDGEYYVVVTDSQSPPEQTVSSTVFLNVITPLSGSYFAAVTALNPLSYWPLNETNKPSTDPSTPETSEPEATNYGALGSSDVGYYLPGTYPGSVAGPDLPGFTGEESLAVAFEHTNWVAGSSSAGGGGFVDVPDANAFLNITGQMTLAAWIQAVPNDGRFQTALGKGDVSYRFDVDGTSSDLLHFADVGGDLDGNPPAGQANDGNWHFVVGVYNGGAEYLYVDGAQNASVSDSGSAAGGVLDFTIGEAPDYGSSRAFDGNIAQVAIFNYALSPAQVQSLYYAADIAPYIVTEPPATLIVPLGTTTNISVVAKGTPNLTYMWSTNNGASLLSGSEFTGATTATLTITDPSSSDVGNYVVVVSNAFGSVTSTPTAFTATDKPVLGTPLPPVTYVYLGTTLSLPVGEVGPTPITNAWYANGSILTDGTLPSGAIISGSKTASLTISNIQEANAGTYAFYASNAFGVTSTSGTVVVDTEPMFRDSGSYVLNHPNSLAGATTFTPIVTNNMVQMTALTSDYIQCTSFWFKQPYYVGAFKVHFVYECQENIDGGVCFVFQNSAQKTNACGDAGTALGVSDFQPYTYTAITNSFEFEINEWDDAGGIQTNGVVPIVSTYPAADGPTGDTNASPEFGLADLGTASEPQDIWISYLGTNMTIEYSNEVSGMTASYETNVSPDFVQQAVGGSNTAYMGFTAGTSLLDIDRSTSEYLYFAVGEMFTISNFSYTPIISLAITNTKSGGAVLSWPTGVGGYQLQSTTSLASGIWTTVPVPYPTNSSGTLYQYTVPNGQSSIYYQLVLTP